MHIHISDTPGQVARDFAKFFEAWLAEKDGPVHVALSGGSTPAALFRLWAEEYPNRIDWEKIHFYWGDERCVPPDDEESNFKMASDLFLAPVGVPSCNVHRLRGELPAEAEAGRYAEEIEENLPVGNGWPVFDLIILGMGGDGHTASIFPYQIELMEADEVCALAQHPDTDQERITLTGKVLNNAHDVAFLVTGQSKTSKVAAILNEEEGAQAFPAAHIKPVHGKVHWFLDQKAAQGVDEKV
ncbi:MAG: 6-phosphogluconolactonase [Phaeodactylibacter sp.]|uniref:6-phosphogluconolactonase n=1 Tax=Phaeodactylibacter sp. TaxID=1940289 RepID=UPI0032ED384B